MKRGEGTRAEILEAAIGLAREKGLQGLSIGPLAKAVGLSKSSFFNHFASKEALQIQLLETAAEKYLEHVISPALTQPKGEPRLRALIDRWMDWASMQGGCVFVAAAIELDDQPGPVRDTLVRLEREWILTLERIVRGAVEAQHLRADLDVPQFSYQLYSLMLGYHFFNRLLREPSTLERHRVALESLFAAAR